MRVGKTDRLYVVDFLRGIAAVMVALVHFSDNDSGLSAHLLIRQIGAYGAKGVQVFFVISGFVLPYSMLRAGYSPSRYPKFVWKRIVRLEPPYLVSMAFVILLGYSASAFPGFRGVQYSISIPQVASHIAYLNRYFGYPSLIDVYWTLAIEFQYYLLIGLLFPLIGGRSKLTAWASFLVMLLISQVGNTNFLPFWLPIFAMGMWTFRLSTRLANDREFLAALLIACVVGLHRIEVVAMAAGLAAALTIAYARMKPRKVFTFLGMISYSLYLYHEPVGVKAMNIVNRFSSGLTGAGIAFVAAWLVVLPFSYLMYQLVERKAQLWSSEVHYGARKSHSNEPVSAYTETAAN